MFKKLRSVFSVIGTTATKRVAKPLVIRLQFKSFLRSEEGRYSEALELAQKAVECSSRHLGKEHPRTLGSMYRLAVLYQNQGRFGEAEQLLIQTVAVNSQLRGREHPDTLHCANGLACLYGRQGRFGEAEPLLKQVLAATKRVRGKKDPQTLTVTHNLAGIYAEQGRYEEAEPLLKQVLEERQRGLGTKHESTLNTVNLLAGSYAEQGRYEEAEPLYEGELLLRERMLGAEHPRMLQPVNNLAALYAAQGRYDQAEPLYEWALALIKLGQCGVLDTLHVKFNAARLYAAKGQSDKAFDLLEQGQQAEFRLLLRLLRISSPALAAHANQQTQAHLHAFISLVSHEFRSSAPHVRRAVDIVLRRKALGMEAAMTQHEALLSDRHPELKSQIRDLTALRVQHERKTLDGPAAGEDPRRHLKTLQELGARLEWMERVLAWKIPELRIEEQLRAVDRQAVALALPQGSTLVEFLRFNVFDFKAVPAQGEKSWKPARYVVFVLPAGQPDAVRVLDLGEAEPIDAMVRTFRRCIVGEGGKREATAQLPGEPLSEVGERLRAAVVDPVLPEGTTNSGEGGGNGGARVFLATDGELNLLPFEALPAKGKGFLLDQYRISYLGTGRDLVRLQAEMGVEAGEALVVADPAFDLTALGSPEEKTTGQATAADDQASELAASESSGGRSLGGLERDLQREGFGFRPLPGTRLEGARIGRRLGVQPWFGEQVLETPLKQLRSPRLLHAATHGFFLSDQKMEPADLRQSFSFGGESLGRLHGPVTGNPMLRSGLALAGSQSWLERKPLPEGAEDGLLTAEDVSTMDLRATEMVVLSACDTGLGEVRHGEGVFGLRRGFVVAGAKTLVMSLWKVPDLATAILMDRFYEHLQAGMERHLALRQAQMDLRKMTVGEMREDWLSEEMIDRLAADELGKVPLQLMRRRPSEDRPFQQPYYWGAFILHGETGPLKLGAPPGRKG